MNHACFPTGFTNPEMSSLPMGAHANGLLTVETMGSPVIKTVIIVVHTSLANSNEFVRLANESGFKLIKYGCHYWLENFKNGDACDYEKSLQTITAFAASLPAPAKTPTPRVSAKHPPRSVVLVSSVALRVGDCYEADGHAVVVTAGGIPFEIGEDEPSYCGAHLLGHEGAMAIRWNLDPCPDMNPADLPNIFCNRPISRASHSEESAMDLG